VVCGKDFITMRMVEDFFKYYNVPLESLRLPNKSCGAQREVIDGVPYYMARISKEKYTLCGGKPLEVCCQAYRYSRIHCLAPTCSLMTCLSIHCLTPTCSLMTCL